jgi:hypothetical protein
MEYSGEQDEDRRIILKLVLRTQNVSVWNGLDWLKIGPVAGSCEYGKII